MLSLLFAIYCYNYWYWCYSCYRCRYCYNNNYYIVTTIALIIVAIMIVTVVTKHYMIVATIVISVAMTSPYIKHPERKPCFSNEKVKLEVNIFFAELFLNCANCQTGFSIHYCKIDLSVFEIWNTRHFEKPAHVGPLSISKCETTRDFGHRSLLCGTKRQFSESICDTPISGWIIT